MKISIISDTHNKHKQLTSKLPGGDIIIHSGDISSVGYKHEINNFCKWFSKLDYEYKILIAGNHDWLFQEDKKTAQEIISSYENIIYLQDDFTIIDNIKFWGSPWTPVFNDWAFNATYYELEKIWKEIPNDVDVIITHGPAYGHLDKVTEPNSNHLGCSILEQKIAEIKPKIHICGHIHTGYGYKFFNDTHFFNASVLDERYYYTQPPFNIEWDNINNKIDFYER